MSSPLRVPVEVLERIVFFTFLPSSSPTLSSTSPSSSPNDSSSLVLPPLGTSHILLVSHGVRELSLPLYYHSISIADDTHWSTFLDPAHGLLVGDLNKERRSFVKELRINVHPHARIPIDVEQVKPAVFDDEDTPSRVLVELARVLLPNVSRLVFFRRRRRRRRMEKQASVDQVVDGGSTGVEEQQPDEAKAPTEVEWTSSSLMAYLEDEQGPRRVFSDVGIDIIRARGHALLFLLDSSSFTSLQIETTLAVASGANRFLLPFHRSSTLAHTPFLIYPSTPIGFHDEASIKRAVVAFQSSEVTSFEHLSLVFEGFPRRVWELRRDTTKVLGTRGSPTCGEKWMWRAEDGTLMRMKETFGDQPREV